jgi:hypothetical protein
MRRTNEPQRETVANIEWQNPEAVDLINQMIQSAACGPKPVLPPPEPYHYIQRPGSPGPPSRERQEWVYHSALTEDGGRPVYPIDQLHNVVARPVDYEHLLKPFTTVMPGKEIKILCPRGSYQMPA